MKVVTQKLYPTSAFPSLHANSGRAPHEPVPLGWVMAWANDCIAKTAPEERNSIMVHGFSSVEVTFENQLTAEEENKMRMESIEIALNNIRAVLPREGLSMSPEAVDKLRSLLSTIE